MKKHEQETQVSDIRTKRVMSSKLPDNSAVVLPRSHEIEERQAELPITPELVREFVIPSSDVLDLFQDTVRQLGFEMVERELTYATAIKKQQKKSMFQYLNCLNWWGHHPNITAVKITIINHNRQANKMKKVCCLKGLVGSIETTKIFIDTFQKKLEREDQSGNRGLILLEQNLAEDFEFKEQNSNPFHLEACSDFLLHKFLSTDRKEEVEITSQLQKQLFDFYQAFKNIKESAELIPSPMKNAISITQDISMKISEVVTRRSQSNVNLILPYFKISVEKYVFDKVEPLVKDIYQEKAGSIERNFLEKREKIIKTLTIKEIFQEVDLNKQLQIAQKVYQKPTPSTTVIFQRENIPFCSLACKELERIKSLSNPRQKIKHCQLMYAHLKSYFYEKSNERYELTSMQDLIPLFICVILFCDIPKLRTEFNLMLDFIQEQGDEYEGEKRSIINLSESYNYIVRDWKI